jgi:hypothetical protein
MNWHLHQRIFLFSKFYPGSNTVHMLADSDFLVSSSFVLSFIPWQPVSQACAAGGLHEPLFNFWLIIWAFCYWHSKYQMIQAIYQYQDTHQYVFLHPTFRCQVWRIPARLLAALHWTSCVWVTAVLSTQMAWGALVSKLTLTCAEILLKAS